MPACGIHWRMLQSIGRVTLGVSEQPQIRRCRGTLCPLPSPGPLDNSCRLVLFAKQLFSASFFLDYLQTQLYGEKVNIHTLPREGTGCWISLLGYLSILRQGGCPRLPDSWPQHFCVLWQVWVDPSCELVLRRFVSWCPVLESIRPSMDHLPLGAARPARTSGGVPSSSELLNASFLGGALGLGCCVLPPAGFPVAVLLWKACSCPTGVLSFVTRPSHPETGRLLQEAFPLVTPLLTTCLTSGLLNRGDSRMSLSITAFTGAKVDTGGPAFTLFSGWFLGEDKEKGKEYLLSQTCIVGKFLLICSHKIHLSHNITIIVVLIRKKTI